MVSREKDPSAPPHPLLSSLVVRPSDSGSDYEPGEVRLEPAPYSRSDRVSDIPGYRIRAGSGSPVRRRNADHRYSPDFDHPVRMPRGRGYSGGRSPGRFRDYSPPYGRGRGRGGRFMGRGFDGPRFDFGPFGGDGMLRGNTNVRPREGDWICPDPTCGNLNFARREHCNNCNRFRLAPVRLPRRGRGYFGPPSHGPPRRFPAPPFDRSPGRSNGYRSPPRGWARDGPRELGRGGPPSRFPDHHMRRERLDYPEEDFRERSKFARPMPPDMVHRDRERPISSDMALRDRGRDSIFDERKGYERPLSPDMAHRDRKRPISPDMALRDRGRDSIFNERKGYERHLSPDTARRDRERPISSDMALRDRGRAAIFDERKGYERRSPSLRALSSSPPPLRGRYSLDERERRRSPIRGRLSPKEYHREMYDERARDERHARDRVDDAY